jgi:hypothetical protein
MGEGDGGGGRSLERGLLIQYKKKSGEMQVSTTLPGTAADLK